MTGEAPWTGTQTETISEVAYHQVEDSRGTGSTWNIVAYTKTTDVTTTEYVARSCTAGQIG